MPTKSLSNAKAGYQGTNFDDMLQGCAACGILTVDSEGKILTLASEAEHARNLPAAKKPTLSFQRLPSPVQSIIREVQATGQAVVDREVVLNLNSSGAVALTLSAIPVTTGKQTASVVVVFKDVSSGKKLDPNLQRLDRLASLGMFSVSMAHEIKNALVAIKTFVDLLPEANPNPELAAVVRREVSRVDSIVSQMLKYGAPARPAFSTVRLHELLNHSLRLVQHRVENQPISFSRKFRASPDSLTGDDHQLEQAFVNLLFNAVESMRSEGALTISTDLISAEPRSQLPESGGPSRLLRIKIADTGSGISADDLGQIFEPFFTTKQNGTGLGLAVTRRIIEEHNGTIHVESHPGKGATFIVLLPAK